MSFIPPNQSLGCQQAAHPNNSPHSIARVNLVDHVTTDQPRKLLTLGRPWVTGGPNVPATVGVYVYIRVPLLNQSNSDYSLQRHTLKISIPRSIALICTEDMFRQQIPMFGQPPHPGKIDCNMSFIYFFDYLLVDKYKQ